MDRPAVRGYHETARARGPPRPLRRPGATARRSAQHPHRKVAPPGHVAPGKRAEGPGRDPRDRTADQAARPGHQRLDESAESPGHSARADPAGGADERCHEFALSGPKASAKGRRQTTEGPPPGAARGPEDPKDRRAEGEGRPLYRSLPAG